MKRRILSQLFTPPSLVLLLLLSISTLFTSGQNSCAYSTTIIKDSISAISPGDTLWTEFTAPDSAIVISYNSIDFDTTSIILHLNVYSNCGSSAIYSTQGLRQSGMFVVGNLIIGNTYKIEWAGINGNDISIVFGADPEWANDICLDPPSDCNFVCNGDFENKNASGTTGNPFWPVGNLNGWDKALNSLGTPDGFWNDGPPPNGSGGNAPVNSTWTGNNGRNQSAGYAALICGHDQGLPNYYEYLQTKLVNPMLPGR